MFRYLTVVLSGFLIGYLLSTFAANAVWSN
jgi:hypothetical protein